MAASMWQTIPTVLHDVFLSPLRLCSSATELAVGVSTCGNSHDSYFTSTSPVELEIAHDLCGFQSPEAQGGSTTVWDQNRDRATSGLAPVSWRADLLASGIPYLSISRIYMNLHNLRSITVYYYSSTLI